MDGPISGLIRQRRAVVRHRCWPEADEASEETRFRSAVSAFDEAQGDVPWRVRTSLKKFFSLRHRQACPPNPPVPYHRRFDLLDQD